jgi:hypothetical protein
LRKSIVSTAVLERNSDEDGAAYRVAKWLGSTLRSGTISRCSGSETRAARSGTTAVAAEEKADREGSEESEEREAGQSARRGEPCEPSVAVEAGGGRDCPPAAEGGGMLTSISRADGLMSQVGLWCVAHVRAVSTKEAHRSRR